MRTTLIFATAVTLALAPLGVMANPGNGNGHANGHDNSRGNPHVVANGNHGCPPGLAGRDPACVPPGQARHGVDTEDWIGPVTTLYTVGDILDVGDFVTVTDLRGLGLPGLAPGEEYAVIDGTLIRLDSDSYEILQLIRAAASVFQ